MTRPTVAAQQCGDDARCRTCGVPYGEIPFDPCAEHAAYEAAQPELDLTDDEIFDIAYNDAMNSDH